METQKNAEDTKRQNRKPLSLWGVVAIILACAIVLGLALTALSFFGKADPAYVSAELQLTFDGAAEGKAPDGYALAVDDLTSDDMIGAALKASALDGSYTVEQIRSSLVVTGSYPMDIVDQTMRYDSLLNFTANRTLTAEQYHPTLFLVTLNNSFDKAISRAKLEALLQNLLSVYQAHFLQVNVQGAPLNDGAAIKMEDYDYPQQLQILQQRLKIISAYAEELYEREPSFRYAGISFNDMVARINSLIDSDIGRLNADMTLNALTKDPERLRTQYEFQLRDLNNRLSRRQQQLANLDTLIDSYEKSEIIYISTADSLTKIDGNSSVTYDALVDLRKLLATENTTINSKIAMYTLMLEDLAEDEIVPPVDESDEIGDTDAEAVLTGNIGEEETVSSEVLPEKSADETAERAEVINLTKANKLTETELVSKRAAFEDEMTTLMEKCDAVASDFSEMVNAWNDSKLNALSVATSAPRYFAPRLFSGAFIVAAFMTAGPVVALGVIVCLCIIISVKKRKERTIV